MITNIQRMCMNDGPGIRTTVFFKGCNLHCPWCSNPENIHFEAEQYQMPHGDHGVYGEDYTEETIWKELRKDERYWRNGGGVTFSGGEPLLHLYHYAGLMKKLRNRKIHMAVETALHVPTCRLQESFPYIDLYIVDVKLMDSGECQTVIGGNIDQYMENIALLFAEDKEVWFRMPCNLEYTMSLHNQEKVIELVKKYPPSYMEIFQTHSLGQRKYESLGLKCEKYAKIDDSVMEEWLKELQQYVQHAVCIEL